MDRGRAGGSRARLSVRDRQEIAGGAGRQAGGDAVTNHRRHVDDQTDS